MRAACVVLFIASTSAADPIPTAADQPPKVTLGASIFSVRFPSSGYHLAMAARVIGSRYLDAQVAVGARVRSDDPISDEDLWSMQVGASSIRWSEVSAVGARASAGYLKYEVTYREGEESWVDDHDAVFGEGALFARLRFGPYLAVEALVAMRLGVLTSGDGLDTTGYLSLGVHVTI